MSYVITDHFSVAEVEQCRVATDLVLLTHTGVLGTIHLGYKPAKQTYATNGPASHYCSLEFLPKHMLTNFSFSYRKQKVIITIYTAGPDPGPDPG